MIIKTYKNSIAFFKFYKKKAAVRKIRDAFDRLLYSRVKVTHHPVDSFTNDTKHFLPGSYGEHKKQEEYGTVKQALSFYNKRIINHLNPLMEQYISEQEMMFISTADGKGECDCSFRAGAPGFVTVLSENKIAYPEYRGNGVFASIGNISENPHIGLLFIDFQRYGVGLHINGKASVLSNEAIIAESDNHKEITLANTASGARKTERWIVIDVEEAYIHCSKNIPRMNTVDDKKYKKTGGDFFTTKVENQTA